MIGRKWRRERPGRLFLPVFCARVRGQGTGDKQGDLEGAPALPCPSLSPAVSFPGGAFQGQPLPCSSCAHVGLAHTHMRTRRPLGLEVAPLLRWGQPAVTLPYLSQQPESTVAAALFPFPSSPSPLESLLWTSKAWQGSGCCTDFISRGPASAGPHLGPQRLTSSASKLLLNSGLWMDTSLGFQTLQCPYLFL